MLSGSVLIQAEVGRTAEVAPAIRDLNGVERAEDVAGPTTSSPTSRRPARTSSAGWYSPASKPWTADPHADLLGDQPFRVALLRFSGDSPLLGARSQDPGVTVSGLGILCRCRVGSGDASGTRRS